MLASPAENLIKLTKPQSAALKKLGIFTVKDLLLHLPFRYQDFSQIKNIRDLKPGENVSIRGKVKSIVSRFSFRGRMNLAEAVICDESGCVKVVWFNQGYLAKSLAKGEKIFLAGTPEVYKNTLQFANPIHEKASDFPVHTMRLVPVYHLKSGLYPRTLRNLISAAMPAAPQLQDELPADLLKNQNLPGLDAAVIFAHFPKSPEQLELAKKRLAFEEIFYNQLAAQKYKIEQARIGSYEVKFDQTLIKNFVSRLPFALTAEQKKAAWDILQDLEKPTPANRLLEGDVGSGKTLVALIAALQAAAAGFQAVLLAPTEILAKQHFETALKYLKIQKLKIKNCLLTNSYAKIGEDNVGKSKLRMLINEGMPGLYIGTHALLQKSVHFKKLALVIIDEQHRFGVQQRATLVKTAAKTHKIPHLLSLTATPIPRSLQLAFFGELEVSRIKTKPEGRKPVITRLVGDQDRRNAYEFIAKQIANGRQAFVITPLIEETDSLGVKSAKTEADALQKIFPALKIGLLHGRMKTAEKEAAMADFLANKSQILVATSVVEVGVDVPNASIMVIEGAERFGLSQLHQFRGRVGRAEHQSYCLVFCQKENDAVKNRLEAFAKTADGFELAEMDLKFRGSGEIYGAAQSGWNFKYFSSSYTDLIAPAREQAQKLLTADPELKNHPELQNRVKEKIIHFE